MVTSYITTSTRFHATSSEVAADINRVAQAVSTADSSVYLEDATALAIAAGWQSPGTRGRAFAELASTGTVALEALAKDIQNAWSDAKCTGDTHNLPALDLLLIWAYHHPSLQED